MQPSTSCRGGTIYSSAIQTLTDMLSAPAPVPSLAEVAREMDIDLGRLRDIVPDAETLLIAVAENATYLLYDMCVRLAARTCCHDPIAQFTALAEAYVEWGAQHPQAFHILGSMPSEVFQGNATLMRYEQGITAIMLKILQRAQQEDLIAQDQDLIPLVAIARTYAHGLVSKMLIGDLARWNPGLSNRTAAKANLVTLIDQVFRR